MSATWCHWGVNSKTHPSFCTWDQDCKIYFFQIAKCISFQIAKYILFQIAKCICTPTCCSKTPPFFLLKPLIQVEIQPSATKGLNQDKVTTINCETLKLQQTLSGHLSIKVNFEWVHWLGCDLKHKKWLTEVCDDVLGPKMGPERSLVSLKPPFRTRLEAFIWHPWAALLLKQGSLCRRAQQYKTLGTQFKDIYFVWSLSFLFSWKGTRFWGPNVVHRG